MPGSRRTAVVVVHGVGKPAPGETVATLVDSLGARSSRTEVSPVHEQVALPDYKVKGSDAHVRRTFPCHLRNVRRDEDEFVFAEVWWGHSRVWSDGLFGMLRLLLSALHLVVGLRVILRAASRGERPLRASLLGWLAWFSSFMLVGPVYAINVLLLIALGMLLVGRLVDHFWELDATRSLLVIGGVVAIALGVWQLRLIGARIGISDARGRFGKYWGNQASPFRRELWVCLVLAGLALALMALYRDESWGGYGAILVEWLTVCFGLATGALALTAAVYLALFAFRDDEWSARSECMAVTAVLQNGLWILLIPNLWFALISAIPTTWFGGDNGALPQKLLGETLIAQGVQWVLGAAVVAAVVVHVLVRALAKPSLRLVVPRIPSLVLMIATISGSSMFLARAFVKMGTIEENQLPWILGLPQWTEDKGIGGYSGVFFGLLLLLSAQVRTVLGLVDDVLSYLEKYSVASGLIPKRPIRSRFRRVIDHLRSKGEFDRWIVVSHSQGSVVVIDELSASENRSISGFRRGASEKRIKIYDELAGTNGWSLVTGGSPFTHLYQHYFPAQYPPLEDAQWDGLRKRVKRWTNVYRVDDFVGTHIDGEDFGTSVSNVGIQRGGHTGYWSDDRFLVELEVELFRRDSG